MRCGSIRLAASLAAVLTVLAPHATEAAEAAVSGSCNVTIGGMFGRNTVTCNFGLTPEQLKQLTEAAVRGATEPLTREMKDVSMALGVTEDATKKP